MHANQLADALVPHVFNAHYEARGVRQSAAATLRCQHEAIVKLRKALRDVMKLNSGEPEFAHALKVLYETREIAK